MKNMMYELIPRPEQGQESFYGRAKVIILPDDTEQLYSYDKLICENHNGQIIRRWPDNKKLSMTTAKHIKAFCGMTRKEFLAIPYTE